METKNDTKEKSKKTSWKWRVAELAGSSATLLFMIGSIFYAGYQADKKYEEKKAKMAQIEKRFDFDCPVIIENAISGYSILYRGNCKDRSTDLWYGYMVRNSDLEIISSDNINNRVYAEVNLDGLNRIKNAKLHVVNNELPRYQSLGNGGALGNKYIYPNGV